MPEIPKFIDASDLRRIRDNVDTRTLIQALGIQLDAGRTRANDLWAFSPFRDESKASLHLKPDGRFYDFGDADKSGGPIELVQAVMATRGRVLDCYQAGLWLLEQGISFLPDAMPATETRPEEKRAAPLADTGGALLWNQPVRQNLLPRLTQQGEHPEFLRRGISKTTCERLGCGYLPAGRSVLAGRIVFQVRGVRERSGGSLEPVVLSHVGRATTSEQEQERGKWLFYSGFHKSRELYGIDHVLLNQDAREMMCPPRSVILVEGCFDVAKLVEAGVLNAVASFGAHLAESALPCFDLIARQTGVRRVFVWYDRDDAGQHGQQDAIALLSEHGFEATGFDWTRTFPTTRRGAVAIPETLQDVCDLSVRQLDWLCKTLNI